MVKINFCPSCGDELKKGSFICPGCNIDVEELFAKGYLLMSNAEDNSIELFDKDYLEEGDNLDKQNMNIKPGDEIVIVVPDDADEDELVIDLDKLGIDIEDLDEDVNIVIQVEGDGFDDMVDFADEDDGHDEPNEWYFDDDPYGIVYYEFPDWDD